MTLLLTVILVALVFEYINGFHDTANSIATVVSTKVLTPRLAIGLAAITNLIGALQNYPGYAVSGSSGSAWKDPIDTLRILLAAQPQHIDWTQMPADDGRR